MGAVLVMHIGVIVAEMPTSKRHKQFDLADAIE